MRLYKLEVLGFQNNTNALSIGIITEDNAFVLVARRRADAIDQNFDLSKVGGFADVEISAQRQRPS